MNDTRVAGAATGRQSGWRLVGSAMLLLAVVAGWALLACGQVQQRGQRAPAKVYPGALPGVPPGAQFIPGASELQQTAHYDVTQGISPAETVYTPERVQAQQPISGQMLLSGTMVMPPGMSNMPGAASSSYVPGWRYIELHVYRRGSRVLVSDARVAITVLDKTTGKTATPPIATMQGVKGGPASFHYGNNVKLASYHWYQVTAQVNGEEVTFRPFGMGA